MSKLPQRLTPEMMQTTWAQALDPVIANPLNSVLILKNQVLATGANVVNHKLGRKLEGWFLIRQRAAASIYDTQDTNQMPQLTLTLESSADVVVDIGVF